MIEVSMMTMNCAAARRTSAHQRRGFGDDDDMVCSNRFEESGGSLRYSLPV
jgi:hypothetical protein